MKNLLFTFLTFFIFTDVLAQYTELKTLGDKEFKNKNYYSAAYYYKKAEDTDHSQPDKIPFYSGGKISKDKIKAERPYIVYQLAESYRLYQNYTEAEVWYNKLLTENYGQNYPLARLWYGVCLRANKHFDEAIKELRQFNAGYKGDSKFTDLANHEIACCLFAKQQYSSYPLTKVTKMQEQWSADAGDYALIKNGKDYWFTSSRLNENNKKHLNNIYSATAERSFKPAIVNFEGEDRKKDIQYGTPSMDGSGKKMYITRWYKEGDKSVLAIYLSELTNGNWSTLKKLNSNVNNEGFNALQPFVTADGKRLFFVSDKPGGQGGDDIWVSDLDDTGNPVNSVNLGSTVNTSSDEQAPFYDQVHKRLVYSSKGFVGLGGFDFFDSYEANGQWSAPNNLGYPINSSKDDLYFYNDPDDENKFYISSDRESDCCLNLFEGHYKMISITVKIADCDTHNTLQNVKVSLVDSITKQTLKSEEGDQNAGYVFKTASVHPLKLLVEAPGHFSKIIPVTTNNTNDTLFTPDICLQAFKVNTPIAIKNIFYDFNKSDLRPESKIALDSLVVIMKNNPQIKIGIASHTDSIGSDNYNLALSRQRAQSCIDYIIAGGISKDRISATGYGKSKPIAPNSLPDGTDNPAGRQLNRRTEFTVEDK